VGRRSRKRAAPTRAERDAARRRTRSGPSRRGSRERPAAPWGSFPLSELVVLIGVVLILWGVVSGRNGEERLAAGLVIASLGGAEIALREHLAGFRSHSTLLAGAAALVVVTVVALGLGPVAIWVLLALGIGVFASAFYAMRELFKRRSGGLGFR
jgi:hypothetical protein